MSQTVERLNAALGDRYRIERQLGEGGMATVYLADDLKHERKVALKVLKPELAAVVGAERFLAEIKTTASLQHPHILPLFDSGEADSFLFYVMPYVEGESLRERLDREHQLPVDEAVQITRNVAEALDYAHRHRVIHRDIKPANILLQDGKPVVSDFGIALAVGVAGGGRLTETGLSLGTPHYMSPEQATGDLSVGAATDIYALGCVLYEMLIGEPPHTGSTPQAILGKIIAGEPTSATKQRPSVPANVDAAIRRALETVPADRFTRAEGFATALAQPAFRHGTAVEGATDAAPAGMWTPLARALAVLSVLFAAVVGWTVFRPESPLSVVRSAIPLPTDLALQTDPGVAFALSPDGSDLVFAGTRGSVTQLWHRRLDQLDASPIPATEGARTPVFSPDGGAVAFVSTGRLMVASLTGAPPLTLVETGLAGGASGLAWSQDGWLYFRRADEGGLSRLRDDGSGREEAVTTSTAQDLQPDAIPGGRGLLFTRSRSGSDPQILLLDLESGESRPLFEGMTARYASSGHIVYSSRDGAVLAIPFDAKRLEVTGPPRALFDGVQTALLAGSQFALSRTGTLLYAEGAANAGLALAEVDLAGNQRLLPLAPRDYTRFGPIWSPDGESVAFSSDSQIYTYNTRLNTTPRQVTFEGGNVSPVFSPDGRRIAFSSNRGATLDIFIKDLASDAPPRSVLVRDGAQLVTQWVADTLLLFEDQDDQFAGALWTLDISDPDRPSAQLYLRTEADLGDVVVSPDGTLAAYRSIESGQEGLYVRSFPEPDEPTVVGEGGGVPFWSPDGNTLYYATRLDRWLVAAHLEREPVLRVLSIDSLFPNPDIGQIPMPGASLHPDGDRFILAVYPHMRGASRESDSGRRLVLVQNFFEELKRLAPS
jgi:WD40 repeat protein